MKSIQQLTLVMACTITMSACASTQFVTTWKSPDAHPIDTGPGAKVVAVVVQDDEAGRRRSEEQLATELASRGLASVASYTLISGDDVMDEDAAKAAFEEAGAVAAVVMRVVSVEEAARYTPSTYYAQPYYRGYWGGYYGYGWGAVYAPGYLSTDTTVAIETLVYDLEQNVLLWAGTSKTTNPTNRSAFIAELVTAASTEMRKAGVIAQ